ncbi:MAG TPA: hypothetical protein VFE47_22135 [Tepidisphaeraceae bacterium]|jgi:hypothetical protein|nr:hypothetical protein [Tepidisphaeraceae bacterium]
MKRTLTHLKLAVALATAVIVIAGCAERREDRIIAPSAIDSKARADHAQAAVLLLRKLDALTIEQRVARVKYDSAGRPTLIVLPNEYATDANISMLDQFPTLVQVKIVCARGPILTDSMAHIGKLPALRELNIAGSPPAITLDVARAIARNGTLRALSLDAGRISSPALQVFAHLPELRRIDIRSDPDFDDAKAALLSGFNRIEELDLSGTNVTDGCLPALAKLPALKRLVVRSTRISQEGIAAAGFPVGTVVVER